MKAVFPLIVIVVIVFFSCKNSEYDSIERQDLFTLDIGPMEDQIALYSLEGSGGLKRTGVAMRDGLFYIADGNSAKIVRFNSYGDLLFMIYNEETNPSPISLRTSFAEGGQATRWAYSYPLREPGRITVDSRRHIYVEDRLPAQGLRFDTENKTILDGVILHFDQNGQFIKYLGQDGVGGTPFPRIVGIYTSTRDDLVVVCRISDGWDVFWFDNSGMLLYLIKIKNNTIPERPDWPASMFSIDSIVAVPDSRRLLIKVDYYMDTLDESTNTRTGNEPGSSVIWTLNVESGTYVSMLEVPLFEYPTTVRQQNVRMFYSMLGAMRGGRVFLYFPVDTGYSILFLDTYTRQQRRGLVRFSNDELRFNDFYLSAEGILCAMLVDDFQAKLVCWRTDAFIGETQ
ncbi:MAG: hypothetical protein FWG99_04325 [Treponema sp.]|nr:hypothetical protein [Treponema sp.]